MQTALYGKIKERKKRQREMVNWSENTKTYLAFKAQGRVRRAI